MPYIRPGIRRLFDLMLRRRDLTRRDVHDEVALHLELRIEQLMRQGLSRDEALVEARRRFGPIDNAVPSLQHTAHRRDRRMSARDWFDSLLQDTKYALRGLRREPAFTGFAVATLALGIGENAAMFGVVDRLLLRGPDHVLDPERVVRILTTVTRPSIGEVTYAATGYVLYDNLRQHTRTFDGLAAYELEDMTLGRGRDARTVHGAAATAGFFPLLGVRATRGRFFLPDEDDTRPSRARRGDQRRVLASALRIGSGRHREDHRHRQQLHDDRWHRSEGIHRGGARPCRLLGSDVPRQPGPRLELDALVERAMVERRWEAQARHELCRGDGRRDARPPRDV
jgi:hypothetical protein